MAKYPIEEWKKAGHPHMTVNSWCNFLRIIAYGKPDLAMIYDIAECFGNSPTDQHSYSEKSIRKWHWERQLKGYKNSSIEEVKQEMTEKCRKENAGMIGAILGGDEKKKESSVDNRWEN